MDKLLEMLMYCKDFEVTSLILGVGDMLKLLENYNTPLSKAFTNHCFTGNGSLKEV